MEGPVLRTKLPLVLRWAQITLLLLFLADTYVYSILDTLLGRYLGTLGITQASMSLAYSIYGMFQLVGSLLLLVLQCWPSAPSIPQHLQYAVIVGAVVVALGSTLLMVLQPASYPLLLVARGLQGSCGALYTIYAMVLLARGFPPEWHMQAVAFMTAGQTVGDSLSPVIGAILYDTVGIFSAYLTQTIVYSLAFLAVLALAFWWRLHSRRQQQHQEDPEAAATPESQQGKSRATSSTGSSPSLPASTAAGVPCTGVVLEARQQQEHSELPVGPKLDQAAESTDKGAVSKQSPDNHAHHQQQGQQVVHNKPLLPALRLEIHSGHSWAVLGGPSSPAVAAATAALAMAAAGAAPTSNISEAVSKQLPDSLAQQQQQGQQVVHNKPVHPVLPALRLEVHSSHSWAVPEGPSSPAAAAATAALAVAAAGPAPTSNISVWGMLRHHYVVCECIVAFWAQMLRAALDVLTPLAMSTTPTWQVGLVFLGEAAGAFTAPFVLDYFLVRFPKLSTRRLRLLAVVCMVVAGPVVLLFHQSLPGALVFFFCFGAAHSVIEALVFKHLVDFVGCEEDSSVLIATMSAFSLFYVTGFTVGAFIAGAPREGNVVEQQVALAAVSGGMLCCTGIYHLLLHRGIISTTPRQVADTPERQGI